MRGYGPGRFSFNSAHGRCPVCEGAGVVKMEMNFLPPAFVRCEGCGGSRFNRETLDVEFHGKNIAQVLEMSVVEAMELFSSLPKIRRGLEALSDTGLGYLKLGQTSPTLSGGEAQRVKLVTHLLSGLSQRSEVRSQKSEVGARLSDEQLGFLRDRLVQDDLELPQLRRGRIRTPHSALRTSSLFILEEPTIGLHMADVRLLVDMLQRLVDAGHSVVVIEHNLDLIAESDWVIDLGPEGGDAGGQVVATGPPSEIARTDASYTGRALRVRQQDLVRGAAKNS